jgi:hypothetical protein
MSEPRLVVFYKGEEFIIGEPLPDDLIEELSKLPSPFELPGPFEGGGKLEGEYQVLPQPVYCCDNMREAVEAGAIDNDQLNYERERYGETVGYCWSIKYCPFCGTAVNQERE